MLENPLVACVAENLKENEMTCETVLFDGGI